MRTLRTVAVAVATLAITLSACTAAATPSPVPATAAPTPAPTSAPSASAAASVAPTASPTTAPSAIALPSGATAFDGKLVICSDIPYPPLEYFDANANPIGSDIEIGQEIA